MAKRKINILTEASTSIAAIAVHIESKGLPVTARKFVNDVYDFFYQLSDDRIVHKPCTHKRWENMGLRCVSYKKKYTIAYLAHPNEIVITDFVSSKLLS